MSYFLNLNSKLTKNIYRYIFFSCLLYIILFIVEWIFWRTVFNRLTRNNYLLHSIIDILGNAEVLSLLTCFITIYFFIKGIIAIFIQRNINSLKLSKSIVNLLFNLLIFALFFIINYFIVYTIVISITRGTV